MIKAYKETHQEGYLSLERDLLEEIAGHKLVDVGLQVAADGRIWLCINGIAFIRFTPKRA